MKRIGSFILLVPLVVALVLFATANTACAASLFGALSNFDVFNDTGQECHGFEIELDGISSSDVVYTFGSTYTQYGNPVKVDFPGGVFVRYESPYDSVTKTFTKVTPIPPGIIPTPGHACWTGGTPAPGMLPYPTAGCEHFGVSLARNPTATHYRWLIADPAKPGSLKPFGTDVSLPAPVWSVPPPPPAAPPAAPPVVVAALPPPEAPDALPGQYGDAIWVKIFYTEEPDPVDLHHLVSDDPFVPKNPAEVEVEWAISQKVPAVIDPGEGERVDEAPLGAADSQAVIRRYEFYKYTEGYDPETHQVLYDNPNNCPGGIGSCVGAFIGAQNAAANLVPGTEIQAEVTITGFVYTPSNHTYSGTVRVKNIGAEDAFGPVAVVFTNLSAGATLLNSSGTFQGSPYSVIPSLSSDLEKLPVNKTVSFNVRFNANGAVSFTPAVYSGSLQPIGNLGSINLTSPKGSETSPIGSTQTITWSSSGIIGNVKIQISRNGGTSWQTLIGSTTNDGTYDWNVTGPATTQARIRVSSLSNPSVSDISAGNFTIGGGSITVTFPNGGEAWPIGSTQTITWSSSWAGGNVKIQLSRNGGTSWQMLTASTPNDGAYDWKVTGPATTQARIRISNASDPSVSAVSNANFTVGGGSITVTFPNGGEVWSIGSTQTITWNPSWAGGNVKIQLSRNGGTSWQMLTASTPNDGAYDWKVTGPATTQARIRISNASDPSVSAVSNANFTVH